MNGPVLHPLVGVFAAILVGLPLMAFAPRLGRAIFDFYVGVRTLAAGSPEKKPRRFLSWYFCMWREGLYYIWLIRVIGAFSIATGILLLIAYLTGSIYVPP
jgi:hypothetical protein